MKCGVGSGVRWLNVIMFDLFCLCGVIDVIVRGVSVCVCCGVVYMFGVGLCFRFIFSLMFGCSVFIGFLDKIGWIGDFWVCVDCLIGVWRGVWNGRGEVGGVIV